MRETYLINPSDKRILEGAGDRIPIGLLSIASNNPNTKIYDLNHTSQTELLRDIKKNNPSSVGISVYTSAILPEAIQLAKRIRRISNTKLIAGGYHATAEPNNLLPFFDAVVQGEGENLLERAIAENGIINGPSPNLDNLNNPDYSMLDMSKYNMQQSGKRTATIISSRGCFNDCAFCGKLSTKVRYEKVDKVLAQIESLKQNGFEAIYFVDDIFTLKKQRMNKIIQDINMPFRVTTRADLVDESKLESLAKNGCDWISLGIESGNNEVLEKSNKRMTIEQNEQAVKLANKYGIKSKGFFILGLPGETEKSAKQTIEFARHLKDHGLAQADFYFLSPFPGTPIWKNPEAFGIEITDKDYTKYLQAGKTAKCYINTKELKAERIEELVMEAKQVWKS